MTDRDKTKTMTDRGKTKTMTDKSKSKRVTKKAAPQPDQVVEMVAADKIVPGANHRQHFDPIAVQRHVAGDLVIGQQGSRKDDADFILLQHVAHAVVPFQGQAGGLFALGQVGFHVKEPGLRYVTFTIRTTEDYVRLKRLRDQTLV